jgi:hypothetical protein
VYNLHDNFTECHIWATVSSLKFSSIWIRTRTVRENAEVLVEVAILRVSRKWYFITVERLMFGRSKIDTLNGKTFLCGCHYTQNVFEHHPVPYPTAKQPERQSNHLPSSAHVTNTFGCPASSFNIVIRPRTGWPKFDSGRGWELNLFAAASRQALGPTQPPIQCLPDSLLS